MKRFSLIARLMPIVFVGGCLSGCTTNTSDHGKWTMSYSTSLSVEHTAADTGETVAKAGWDLEPWVKDLFTWWIKKPGGETEGD